MSVFGEMHAWRIGPWLSLVTTAATATIDAGGEAVPLQAIRLVASPALGESTRAALSAAVADGFAAASHWLAAPLHPGATVDPVAEVDAIEVEYLSSHEAMGLRFGRTEPWLYDTEQARVVFISNLSGGSGADADERAAAAALSNARCAGAFAAIAKTRPAALATPLADALAASFAPGDDATLTARDLRGVGLLPALPDLLKADPRRSPELARVAFVSLLRSLGETTRAADFAALTAAARPEDAAGNVALERARANDANDTIRAIDTQWKARLDAAPATGRTAATPPIGLHGFCFSHEGYRWVDGYGSRAAAGSLARLRDLGANAVSLMPFAFQREIDRPGVGLLFDGQRRGFAPETDLSVAVTAADAAAMGLTVVLKPHLWCGHGHWCGEISMSDPADWPHWFAEYERLAVHYALLARRCGIAVLCIGTELKSTTQQHEGEWRALIAKVRAIGPGCITYCANWGDEVERLPFWDALDVIGLSAYWPLADAPAADDAAIGARFESILERMQRLGRLKKRPVWFLEIGFPDVRDCWIKPHENGGSADGGVDQGRAYRIVLASTQARRFPDGLFFWKWPSREPRPDDGRRRDHPLEPGLPRFDYWPWGRAAEQAVRDAWKSPR